MGNTWLVWMATYALTGNPLVAVAAVLLFMYGGDAWWHGRLWRPWAIVQQWMRIRELRAWTIQNPHDLTARADLGRLLVARGSYAEARPHLEQVVARAPTLAQPAWNLGRACLGVGDLEAGTAQIERALSIRKDTGYGQPMFDVADFLAARERWAEAVAWYERGIEAFASSSQAWYKLGRCRLAAGDRAGAKKAFEEAMLVHDAAPAFKRAQERQWRWRAWWWARKT